MAMNSNPQSPYYELSHFSNHSFNIGGYEWPTVQHYIEAQKFYDPAMKQYIRQLATPEEAANLGKQHTLPENLNEDHLYRTAMLAKLYAHPFILTQLLSEPEHVNIEGDLDETLFRWQCIRNEFGSIAILESEKHVKHVCADDLIERHQLIQHLKTLPVDAFSKLRYLQPEVGCFNRCSFCSQSAGINIWSLNVRGLKNLFSALKTVGLEYAYKYQLKDGTRYLKCNFFINDAQTFHKNFVMPKFGLLGYARHAHRPGVIFPYLDNDIGTYPHLKEFIQYASEDLGVRVRLSTVGYSRKNLALQQMHEAINEDYAEGVAGVRLSLTPYTYGFSNSELTSREDFKEDVTNFLATYKPLIESLGTSQRTGCVEFRFKPLMEHHLKFHEIDTNERHIIAVGPYAFVSNARKSLRVSRIRVDENGHMHIDGTGMTYRMIQSDLLRDLTTEQLPTFVDACIDDKTIQQCTVKLYIFENDDGEYYAVNPRMTDDGMTAKQFYPQIGKRPTAGYIDSERYFMNSVILYKKLKGKVETRRDPWYNATWSDVAGAVHQLMHQADEIAGYNAYAACYIREEILPLVQLYAEAILSAGYAPSYFFLSTFTIDTGSICNLGKAYATFRHLTSRQNMPITPQQERSFGKSSALSLEGEKWRIAVAPFSNRVLRETTIGRRNLQTETMHLSIEHEDLSVSAIGDVSNIAAQRQLVPFHQIEVYKLNDGRARIVGAR